MIGLDVTTSIAPERFVQMRDTLIPQIVLARLQPGDEVAWVPINANPERELKLQRLTGKMGTDKGLRDMHARLRQVEQSRDPKIINNLGSFLAYGKRTGTMLEAERQRLVSQGKKPVPVERLVFSLFTDGELPAGQSVPPSGPWPTNVAVWIWGVESVYETRLKQWLTTDLELPEGQVTLVRFSDWQLTEAKTFGARIGRPFADLGFLKRLRGV